MSACMDRTYRRSALPSSLHPKYHAVYRLVRQSGKGLFRGKIIRGDFLTAIVVKQVAVCRVAEPVAHAAVVVPTRGRVAAQLVFVQLDMPASIKHLSDFRKVNQGFASLVRHRLFSLQ